MHSKVRVLIIDDNQNFVNKVKQYFKNHAVISVVLEAHDGNEGLDMIINAKEEYDIILLDLVMPNKDGMYVLEQLQLQNDLFNIIVISGLGVEEVIRKTCNYGVKYFILKPFLLADLESKIIELMLKKDLIVPNKDLESLTINLLHSLGIPSHLKGFKYLKESILLGYENDDTINQAMKRLYPQIALKYNTTPLSVEKAIRHAIEIGFNRGDYELVEKLFGHSIDFNKTKPTNLEFITTLIDKLKLDISCYKVE
jgi:two-component system response regulator (stage 0 sporulation protein A)